MAGASAYPDLDPEAITDAYVYLLGPAMVVRQQITDLQEPGVGYNRIKCNPVGSADFVNPNLDVAYLEAWIAVDDKTPVLLEVPEIEDRYYTAQILDEWGEVITNINERNYPLHSHGKFLLVTPGSHAAIPNDALRIELSSSKAKLLGRIELKDDEGGAVALQKKFNLTPLGKPVIREPVPIPIFGNKELIGAELFDHAQSISASAHDSSPIAAQMQARVQLFSRRSKNAAQRSEMDRIIKEHSIPRFLKYAVTQSGRFQNHWLGTLGTGNYGPDYWRRTAVNVVGLWANTNDEVVYFVGTEDADGAPLDGANDYLLEFPAAGLPETVVDAYWSVILVDVPDYRVVPNRLSRFNFNDHSGLETAPDGSLKILISKAPNEMVPESNWLPAPEGRAFSLTLRIYVPKEVVKAGGWFPPAIERVGAK